MKRRLTKNLPDLHVKTGIWGIIRMSLSAARIVHRGLGPTRVIIAYLFFLFALVSLLFTIKVPMGANFQPATLAAKTLSRVLTLVMMIMNFGVYGMVMSWHKSRAGLTIIRIAVMGILLYFDVFIIVRTIHRLIQEGTLF